MVRQSAPETTDSTGVRIVLEGIDQARRVEVGPDYLSQTTLGGEARRYNTPMRSRPTPPRTRPSNRAYMTVDPSMNKQASYVAPSHTREQSAFQLWNDTWP